VDEFKRLHAAVVDRESSARTLRSFLPAQVAERLTAGAAALEALHEEIEATVLFSDIRGFSTLAEDMPARDLAVIATRHLSAMAEVVVAHGGTIDKFAGDSVMALFGAPDPMPDHAARALACALAMQARQAALNEEAAHDGRSPLEMGVGVNSGVVIAGTVGGGGRLEYTVVGDAVNVAQRLQAAALGGEVLTSAATIDAVPGIAAEPLGALEVKGRRAPVEAFRVRGGAVPAG
jgi:class 3 adenylate cyclase